MGAYIRNGSGQGGGGVLQSSVMSGDAQIWYIPFTATFTFTPGAGVPVQGYLEYSIQMFQNYSGGPSIAAMSNVYIVFACVAQEVLT